ncbi:MAG: hypothetical protein K8F54_05225 [Altibacter sp.]|uniref:hypothetical protein n=1 Tax=Altibacter sp. TaxID=2024823 RepID=UPI001DC94D8D|nr:hypothetical protein [Altibacter sp.]MBZ0326985.1 hypothetical protein [Altibacter sp.]
MKNVILIVASVFILSKPLWPVVDYVVNYNYIIEKLCENRDKPEMQCNGKCYLSKQLSKEAKDAETNPFNKSNTFEFSQQVVFLESLVSYHFSMPDLNIEKQINSEDQIGFSSLFVYVIPKPPEA